MKWRFIEESWNKLGKREWIRTAKRAFNNLLDDATAEQQREAEQDAHPTTTTASNSASATLDDDDLFGEAFTQDDELDEVEAAPTTYEELQVYLKDLSHRKVTPLRRTKAEPERVGLTKGDSPVRYWMDNKSRWPHLARPAPDIFSTPAMSNEPERQFSTSGALVSPRRRLLSDVTIRNLMCVRGWIASSVVTLSRYNST